MADAIENAPWFAPWVSKTESALTNVFGWDGEYIIFIGIKPEAGANFATEEEWPVLEKAIQRSLKKKSGEKGHIAGAPAHAADMIEFTRIPISQLKRKLAQATGSTYAIVGSCPGQHMAEVRKTIKGNKNVQETFGSAEDLANNLAAVDLGGGGAGASHAARAPPHPVEVCNAGSNSVNGWFRRDGDYEGRPQYKLITNESIQLYWLGGGTGYGGLWRISNGGNLYYNNSNTATPPSTGWVPDGGQSPAPTVRFAGN